MLSSLLLASVLLTTQDVVEKIHVQNATSYEVYTAITGPDLRVKLEFSGIKQVTYDPTDESIVVKGSKEAILELRARIAEIESKIAAESVHIPLKYRSAHYMAELLTQSGRWKNSNAGKALLPEGIKLYVDARTNSVVARGPEASLSDLRALIAQFDIKSMTVSIEVEASLPLLDRRFSASGQIENNSSLNYKDDTTDTRLSVTPRINDDGSVQLLVAGGTLGTTANASVRVKAGGTAFIRFYPGDRNGQTVMFVMTGTGVVTKDALSSNAIVSEGFDLWTNGPAVPAPKAAEVRMLVKVAIPVQ